MTPTTRSKAERLAFVATAILEANGRHRDPTLHDIALAVVHAAPPLGLSGDDEAVSAEIAATKCLLEQRQRKWNEKKVVILDAARPRARNIAARLRVAKDAQK